MAKRHQQLLLIVCGVLSLGLWLRVAAAQQPPSDQPVPNISGNWTIYSRSDDGKTDEKSMEIKQDGNKLSGHFKGPNQSGGIEGTIDGNHVVIRTKTNNQFTFRGQVQGDSIKGRWGIFVHRKGPMHGDWEARRTG